MKKSTLENEKKNEKTFDKKELKKEGKQDENISTSRKSTRK